MRKALNNYSDSQLWDLIERYEAFNPHDTCIVTMDRSYTFGYMVKCAHEVLAHRYSK